MKAVILTGLLWGVHLCEMGPLQVARSRAVSSPVVFLNPELSKIMSQDPKIYDIGLKITKLGSLYLVSLF